ncbi:uncharacterized protein [Bemisia tabaci]|uniref:uncharacterized protein isoform X1 n=1 Tax=Bemisia tabaci TaxID=7038 RepID=UPI003B28627E
MLFEAVAGRARRNFIRREFVGVKRAVKKALRKGTDLKFLLAILFFILFSAAVLLVSKTFMRENRLDPLLNFHQSTPVPVSRDSPIPLQRNNMLPSRDGRHEDQSLPSVKNLTAIDGDWQPVAATAFKFFVYSAYLDVRVNKLRVIAAAKTIAPDRVSCRFWSSSGNESRISPARVQAIRENWNLMYTATFVLCSLPIDLTFELSSVSVIHQLDAPITNHLLIRNLNMSFSPTSHNKRSSNFTSLAVCIQPVHNQFNDVSKCTKRPITWIRCWLSEHGLIIRVKFCAKQSSSISE